MEYASGTRAAKTLLGTGKTDPLESVKSKQLECVSRMFSLKPAEHETSHLGALPLKRSQNANMGRPSSALGGGFCVAGVKHLASDGSTEHLEFQLPEFILGEEATGGWNICFRARPAWGLALRVKALPDGFAYFGRFHAESARGRAPLQQLEYANRTLRSKCGTVCLVLCPPSSTSSWF